MMTPESSSGVVSMLVVVFLHSYSANIEVITQ